MRGPKTESSTGARQTSFLPRLDSLPSGQSSQPAQEARRSVAPPPAPTLRRKESKGPWWNGNN